MAEISKRLVETTLNARSGAYRWLRRNHAEISAVFAAQAQPPSWKALVKIAADEGVTFTPNALRKAWLRLEHDLAREANHKAAAVESAPTPTPVRQQPRSAAEQTPASTPPPIHSPQLGERTIQLRAADGKTTITVPRNK